jgi:hypothetical protein
MEIKDIYPFVPLLSFLLPLVYIILFHIMPKKRHSHRHKKTITKVFASVGDVKPCTTPSVNSSSILPTPSSEAGDHIKIASIVSEWLYIRQKQAEIHTKISQLIELHAPADDPDIVRQIRDLISDLSPEHMAQRETDFDRSFTPATKATTSIQTSPIKSPGEGDSIPEIQSQLMNQSQLCDTTTIACKLNKFDISLKFSNSGQNDMEDIQTYLQEKLDVLEFIQQDHTRRTSVDLQKSKIRLPSVANRSAIAESTLSVGDWLNEDITNQASLDKTAPTISGGFFIGTPAPSACNSPEDRDTSLVDAAILNDSDIRWETDSMISSASFSPASRRHRGSSRSRIRSTSSTASRYSNAFMTNGRSRASRLASSYAMDDTSIITSVLGKSFDRGSPEMTAAGFHFGSRWF